MKWNKQLLIGTAIIFLLIIAVPPVLANVNGTFYWRNTTPQNDIYEKVVMPGDTIVLGKTYDLSKVSGYSKAYAWWHDASIEGTTCTPDVVVNTSHWASGGNSTPDHVFLDPEVWKTGDWFQWDGCYQKKYQKGNTEPQYSPYLADDNQVFTVIYDPAPPVHEFIAPITTATPMETAKIRETLTTINQTPIPEPIKEEPWPWWYYAIIIGVIILIVIVLW